MKKDILVKLLILSTIILTALAICFSYGVYQNYNAIIKDGESELKTVTLDAVSSDKYLASSITKGNLIEMLSSLPKDTQKLIKSVYCQVIGDDSIYSPHNLYSFSFHLENGNIVGAYINDDNDKIFSDEEYASGKRVVKIGEMLYGEGSITIISPSGYYIEERWSPSAVDKNQKTIVINGEEYEIIGTTDVTYDPFMIHVFFPFTSLDDNTQIRSQPDGTNAVNIEFANIVKGKQYNDICEAVNKHMSDYAAVQPVELTETTETYYYKTIIGMAVLITILCGINIAVLYRYIVEKDRKKLNVFRLCGCTRGRAIITYIFKYLIVSIPLFVISELCYSELILPSLSRFFEFMSGSYSIKIYSIIFAIYVVVSTILLLIMLLLEIPKKVVREGLK